MFWREKCFSFSLLSEKRWSKSFSSSEIILKRAVKNFFFKKSQTNPKISFLLIISHLFFLSSCHIWVSTTRFIGHLFCPLHCFGKGFQIAKEFIFTIIDFHFMRPLNGDFLHTISFRFFYMSLVPMVILFVMILFWLVDCAGFFVI